MAEGLVENIKGEEKVVQEKTLAKPGH